MTTKNIAVKKFKKEMLVALATFLKLAFSEEIKRGLRAKKLLLNNRDL